MKRKFLSTFIVTVLLMGGTANAGFFDWVGSFFKTSGTDLHQSADGLVGHWMLNDTNEWYGTELVTNGTMEADANWADTTSAPAANAQSTTQVHGGLYSRLFTPDAADEGIKSDAFTTVTGKRYRISAWVYPDDGTTVTVTVRKGDDSGDVYDTSQTGLTQDAWNALTIDYIETAGGAGAYIIFDSGASTSGNWYIDDVSIKELQAADSTINEVHGSLYQDSTVYGTDRYGTSNGAMDFNGTSDFIDVGDTSETSVKTISFWVQADDITSHTDYPIDLNGTDYISIVDGEVTLGGFAGGTNTIYTNNVSGEATIPNITVYHHVVVTSTTGRNASDLDIARLEGTGYHDGKIHDVRLYNRVLSAWEIKKLYEETIPDPPSRLTDDLIARWTLADNEETTGSDLMSGWDFTSGWSTMGNTTILNATQFSVTTGGTYRVYKAGYVTIGKRYRMTIAGAVNTGTDVLQVYNYATTTEYGEFPISTTTNSTTFDFTATGDNTIKILPQSQTDNKTYTVSSMTLKEIKASDTTGNANHASLYQNSTVYTTDQNSITNGAMEFGGYTPKDYLDLGTSSNFSFADDPFSMSGWYYFDATDTRTLIAKGTAAGSDYEYRLRTDANSKLFFALYSPTASAYIGRSDASALTTGQWYHIVTTYDGTTASSGIKIYIDGIQTDDADYQVGSYTTMTDNSGHVYIGKYVASEYFDGKISDIRFYDRALTAREVNELYTQPTTVRNKTLTDNLVGRWTLANRDGVTTGSDLLDGWDLTSGWTATGATPTTNAFTTAGSGGVYKTLVTVGKRYRMRIAGSATGNFRVVDGAIGQIYKIIGTGSFDETFDFTVESNTSVYLRNTDAGTTTITSMTLYEVQATDVSGNAHHGTVTGAVTATDHNSVADSALDFDGTADSGDDVISAGSDFIGAGDATISAWIYPESLGEGGYGYIFTNSTKVALKLYTSNQIRFSSDVATAEAFSATSAFSFDQWTHVVATRTSAGTANIYVNGVLSGSADQASGTPATGSTILIGNNSSSTRTFDGRISDVRVWNRVLSPWEIWKLYNES